MGDEKGEVMEKQNDKPLDSDTEVTDEDEKNLQEEGEGCRDQSTKAARLGQTDRVQLDPMTVILHYNEKRSDPASPFTMEHFPLKVATIKFENGTTTNIRNSSVLVQAVNSSKAFKVNLKPVTSTHKNPKKTLMQYLAPLLRNATSFTTSGTAMQYEFAWPRRRDLNSAGYGVLTQYDQYPVNTSGNTRHSGSDNNKPISAMWMTHQDGPYEEEWDDASRVVFQPSYQEQRRLSRSRSRDRRNESYSQDYRESRPLSRDLTRDMAHYADIRNSSFDSEHDNMRRSHSQDRYTSHRETSYPSLDLRRERSHSRDRYRSRSRSRDRYKSHGKAGSSSLEYRRSRSQSRERYSNYEETGSFLDCIAKDRHHSQDGWNDRNEEWRSHRRNCHRSQSPSESRERERSREEYKARIVFVTQMSSRTSSQDLRDFFSVAGEVYDVCIMADPTQSSMCIAYVQFVDEDSVPWALQMSGKFLHGKPVTVRRTKTTEQKAPAAASVWSPDHAQVSASDTRHQAAASVWSPDYAQVSASDTRHQAAASVWSPDHAQVSASDTRHQAAAAQHVAAALSRYQAAQQQVAVATSRHQMATVPQLAVARSSIKLAAVQQLVAEAVSRQQTRIPGGQQHVSGTRMVENCEDNGWSSPAPRHRVTPDDRGDSNILRLPPHSPARMTSPSLPSINQLPHHSEPPHVSNIEGDKHHITDLQKTTQQENYAVCNEKEGAWGKSVWRCAEPSSVAKGQGGVNSSEATTGSRYAASSSADGNDDDIPPRVDGAVGSAVSRWALRAVYIFENGTHIRVKAPADAMRRMRETKHSHVWWMAHQAKGGRVDYAMSRWWSKTMRPEEEQLEKDRIVVEQGRPSTVVEDVTRETELAVGVSGGVPKYTVWQGELVVSVEAE